MARALVFRYGDEVSELPLTRVDRGKLYGTKKRVVTLSCHHAIPLWPPFQPITDCRAR